MSEIAFLGEPEPGSPRPFSAATVAPSQARAKKLTAPVMPAQRPKQLDLVDNGETTGSVDPAATVPKAIGKKPRDATRAVIRTGRRRVSEPLVMAS